jgi:thiamine-monophosphate kinase
LKLRDIGEKKLIAEYVTPLFNPAKLAESVGDDCALVCVDGDTCVCVSTDRVPPDLISFKLGLINIRQLGRYLAILNISDIAAAGGEPKALLLNLAFPPDFALADFCEILAGAKEASECYGVAVVGGDLSDSREMNLVATSIGIVKRQEALFRSGAHPGDKAFCSGYIGIVPTAFLHYLYKGEISSLELSSEEENVLTNHFRQPEARVALGRWFAQSGCCTAAMDVTDGISQSFSEIAAASSVGIVLDEASLPIHAVCERVVKHYNKDLMQTVLAAGADFQLVGTLNAANPAYLKLPTEVKVIGDVIHGSGLYLRSSDGDIAPLVPSGWNYYV